MKKAFAIIFAMAILCSIFASCGKEEIVKNSSEAPIKESSNITVSETESKIETSSMQTSSVIASEEETSTSSKKGALRGEYIESSSVSSDIKQYKKKNYVMLGAYHLRPQYCTAYGTDRYSRLREFEEVVKAGYFNTFFLTLDEYLVDSARIVAENGYTFWVSGGNFRTKPGYTIEDYTKKVEYYLNLLKEAGFYDLLHGFTWDEPIWNGQPNEDFLAQSEVHYKKFGLRNFPVFATGEFTDLEGNSADLGIDASEMKKLETYAAKYLTDISYDAYGVDPRDSAKYSQTTIANWQKKIGPNVVDGKTYYLGFKELLKKKVGHPANYWYYPCAYSAPLAQGATGGIRSADEDYWIAHLDFMAEDILKEEYPGGLVLYTYYTKKGTGFAHRCDLKDSFGNYKIYPESDIRFLKYSQALRDWTQKFNAVSPKLVDLGL